MNHILIRSNKRVYCFGDNSKGALGNKFHNDEKRRRNDWDSLTCLDSSLKAEEIFTTDYSSFILTKNFKGRRLFGFGLNNYNQLGMKSNTENLCEHLPVEVTLPFELKDVKNIQGGENHTFILTVQGEVYGAGRNDDG